MEQLARRHKKLVKRGKHFNRLDASGRHKLRIQAKKLRYAIEFLSSTILEPKAVNGAKSMLRSLKGMQSCLGDLNDIAVHEEILSHLAAKNASSSQRKKTISLIVGREKAREKSLLAAATKAQSKFSKTKAFWK
jgi:CHAD domain-containing protein